jgi:hypothetical protein
LSNLGFFSIKSFKNSKSRKVLEQLEDEDLEKIRCKIKLTQRSYLKLLSFLDSMIENLIEKDLKTKRFLNGTG